MQLGWIEPKDRTHEQHEAHALALSKMPAFFVRGATLATPPIGTKFMLTDVWKSPAVIAALGFAFPGVHQLTGSCVGAGGGNVLFTLAAIEALRLGQQEKVFIPFWLLPYGRSRFDMGERGQGEGSLGSTFAQACREDGVVDATMSRLPAFQNSDGLVWGESTEMAWSAGDRIGQDWLTESRKHLVHTTAALHSGAEVRDAILNGYPVTRAFGSFCDPGTAKVQGSGENAALVGSYNGKGGHQQSWLGYWNNPDLGELIWEPNQWGLKVYGDDPGGGPAGGVWQKLSAVDQQCRSRDSEIFAFSQFDGYPAQEVTAFL